MTSYSSLGFVENDRMYKSVQRDVLYTGASNNPSKKEYTQSVKAPPSAPTTLNPPPHSFHTSQPPLEAAVVPKKIAFLEAQDKRRMAEVSEMRGMITELQRVVDERVSVCATMMESGIPCSPDEDGNPGERQPSQKMEQGEKVKLLFPMKRQEDGSVWMRSLRADRETAVLSLLWVEVRTKDGRQVVSNFSI